MKKAYYVTVASIFTIIAVFHLIRAIQGWEAVIGGVVVPIWVSWAAVLIAGYMAVRGFQLSRASWFQRLRSLV